MPQPKAIALVSSGLDSTVAAFLARENGSAIALVLTFDYGQRAAPAETRHAAEVAEALGTRHQVVAIPYFRLLGKSGALVDKSVAMPSLRQTELDDLGAATATAKQVWVPNRNGVFLEIAAAFAEDLGASQIIVGFNKEEAATFPDNSEAYLAAITTALSFSTANQVRVLSPTATLTKTEIVRELVRLGISTRLLWSCYEDGPQMCGKCESCQRLKRALSRNGVSCHAHFADPVL